jgi:hypothetical protein
MLNDWSDRSDRPDPPWLRFALWFGIGFFAVMMAISVWRGNW